MQQTSIKVGDLTLAALESGPRDGPPVLALHGWMDNAASFVPLASRLHNLHIIALDLPGHGLSPDAGDYFAYQDNLTIIHQALAALGWDRCVLLAHSMGGGLAAIYAGLFPQTVAALISLDMFGPIAMDDEQLLPQLRKALAARAQRPEQRFFATREAALAARVNDNFSTECADVLAQRGLDPTTKGWTWRGDRRLKWPSMTRFTEAQADQILHAIQTPHLVLRASRALYPQAAAMINRRLAQTPPTQAVTVDGGHHLHMENPDSCAAEILRFLSQPPVVP